MEILTGIALCSVFAGGCWLANNEDKIKATSDTKNKLVNAFEHLDEQDQVLLKHIIDSLSAAFTSKHLGSLTIPLENNTLELDYGVKGQLKGIAIRTRTEEDDQHITIN